MKVVMKDGVAMVGENVGFERIRRITGYLVDLTRFNDAKRSEERDRIKHAPCRPPMQAACCK